MRKNKAGFKKKKSVKFSDIKSKRISKTASPRPPQKK